VLLRRAARDAGVPASPSRLAYTARSPAGVTGPVAGRPVTLFAVRRLGP